MANADIDINLSGEEDELPPGVQPGRLEGDDGASDIPPPEAGEFVATQNGSSGDLPWVEGETPVEGSPPPPEEPPPLAPEPVSPESPGVREPASPPDPGQKKPSSGTIDRPYRIFEIKPADVDGRIIDVPVPVVFNSDTGETMETLVARNRDLAITKAAKAFGPGWTGTLVAVPISMWEPEPVFNKPRNSFSVQIGDQ